MKVLLTAVNAKYIHSNPALYSLRAFAGCYREHITIAEYTINHQKQYILAEIFKQQPNIAAFSCYIWNWEIIQDLVVELHKIMPELLIWLGGPEVSYDAREVLERLPMLTGIMIGEGEETFLELMEHYVDNRIALADIKGIVSKGLENPPRPLTDLNKLPFLYHDLSEFENKIIYYESSRGCPFRCSYCLSSIDKEVRLRDIEIVKKELQFFLEQGVSQVKFVDRTFNCDHAHAMAIWTYLKENDNGVTNFHFEISADIINEEEIALLNSLRTGLVQLEIGVQSTNQDTLTAINRFVKFSHLEQVVEKIKVGNNIHIHLDLIAGLPFEGYESFAKSFNDVYAMHPEQLQLGFLKVLKGSAMYEKSSEYGINYTDKPPYEVLYSKWLPYKDILRLKSIEEMVELYYNSNQFVAAIPALERLFESPFVFYEALAVYYEQNGYFLSSPSRAYRYDVLLGFALKQDAAHGNLYKELLTYDMYLRENLKSRPVFAKDMTVYKEKIRTFYEKEERERLILKEYHGFNAKQMSKMTHMECFRYPVWKSGAEAVYTKLAAEEFLLFDYQNRDKLTNQAAVIHL